MEFTQKYFEGNSAAHARAVYKGSGYERNVHKYIVFEENVTDKLNLPHRLPSNKTGCHAEHHGDDDSGIGIDALKLAHVDHSPLLWTFCKGKIGRAHV